MADRRAVNGIGVLDGAGGGRFLTGAARRRPIVRRGGFSLVELIVSIGLLGLMMSLAGKIFALSIESTGQATSLINVSKSLRLLEEALRNDLCGVDPDRSMLIIQGNPIDAYWTANDAAVDGDEMPTNGAFDHAIDAEREDVEGNFVKPRADILMLFTSRPTSSIAYPGVRSNLAQVVYGHAELGELDSAGNWATDPVPFPPDDVTFFDRPSDGWHLARRSVALIDSSVAVLTSLGLIDGGVTPPQSPDEGAMGSAGPFPLRDGEFDFIVQSLGGKLFFDGKVVSGIPWTDPNLPEWYLRSRLDVTPPARAATRLGHYFLPKCANFKVEWTPIGPGRLPKHGGIDLREMLWIDPGVPNDWVTKIGDIRSRIEALDTLDDRLDQLDDGNLNNGVDLLDELNALATRMADPATNGWFSRDPDTGDGSDPMWPTALRVTVDVFDDSGKFTRPIHHVMVIPVGGGS